MRAILTNKSRQDAPTDIGKIQQGLNALYTDLSMLRDGEWIPDDDSCAASLDSIAKIVTGLKELGVLPQDYQPVDGREKE